MLNVGMPRSTCNDTLTYLNRCYLNTKSKNESYEKSKNKSNSKFDEEIEKIEKEVLRNHKFSSNGLESHPY